MICLDANAFYWYYGRERLHLTPSVPKIDVIALRSWLDGREDKCIPTSVMLEMIVHFRNHPECIKQILSFQEEKGLRIYNNLKEYCFTNQELEVIGLMDIETIKNYSFNLLKKKIEIETNFSYVFLQMVSLLYANYYLKTYTSINKISADNILSYFGRGIQTYLKDDYRNQLKTSLETGYNDQDKGLQYLKKKYMDLLTQNCIISHILTDTFNGFINDEEDLYAIMCQSADVAKSQGLNINDTMTVIKTALSNDPVFLAEAECEIRDIFIRKGYTKHQALYVQHMLGAWLERGQKIRKNDIFDMLCVGSLDKKDIDKNKMVLFDQSTYLLTFDEIMMKFMVEENIANAQCINRFMLPDHKIL